MAFAFILPLRIAQAIFAIIVLGLTGYVASWWNSYWHDSAPSEINFMIFAAVWSILTIAFLIVVPWKMASSAANHKFGILAAEALAMLFWFASFIALAVFLSNRVCFGHVCNVAKAAVVFASLEWVLFAATTVLAALHVVRTRGSGNHRADPQMEISNKGTTA